MEALMPLALFRFVRREYAVARGLAQRLLGLAERAKATPMVAGAHYLLGHIPSYLGELETAREHLEVAIGLFGPGPFRNFGEAQYVQAATIGHTTTLLYLGYPAAALKESREALDAMRRLADLGSLARALLRETLIHVFLRDSRTALERAEELLVLANEHAMAFHVTNATFFRGWAIAEQGRGQEGLAEMSRALQLLEGFGGTTTMYGRLADTYCKSGRLEEGLATVATALSETERSGERTAETELHRVKGELLLICDPPDEAEAERCLRTAIDFARRQKARFFELRATTSLARLLKRQGKIDEARAMLSGIYKWFTEGFDTADLKDAKALLDELRA